MFSHKKKIKQMSLKINLDTTKEYLLALSGGVDSVSMYYNLLNQGFKFKVVHINHHTRGSENSCEQLLVEKMCKQDKIDCFVAHFFEQNGDNFHNQAREFRLSIYQKIVKYYNLSGVIIAHHLDDQVENILMYKNSIMPRLLKKESKYQGLTIYRPWLNILKLEIRKYAKKNDIIYYEDSSNESDKYLRNFVRHHHPLDEDEKRKLVSKNLEKVKLGLNYQMLDLNKNNYLEVSDKPLFLYNQIKKITNQSVSYNQVNDLIKLIDFCGYKEYRLGNDFYFIQSYDNLSICKKTIKLINQDKVKTKVGINEFNGIKFNTIIDGFIRTKLDGDKIKYSWGSKKVSRVMIDLKIPKEKRSIWPIIVNEYDEVIAVIKPSEVIKE